MEKIICKNCNKQIKFQREKGFCPVLTGKTYRNRKTKEVWVVCWDCLKSVKIRLAQEVGMSK